MTADSNDFPLLHEGWVLWTRSWSITQQHAGILILPNPTAAERLRCELNTGDVALLINTPVLKRTPHANELWYWRRGPGWVRHPLS